MNQPTMSDQATTIARDKVWKDKRRLCVVIEDKDNGHKIHRMTFDFHEIKPGQDVNEVAIVALQHAQDQIEKGFKRT